jgi:hypothetical protein
VLWSIGKDLNADGGGVMHHAANGPGTRASML